MGPLDGVRVIEIAGIGPGPFCAMMLADMGAEVVRIDRRSNLGQGSKYDVLNRGRRSLALDLKKPEAVDTVLRLVEQADVLMEGFRPGVMERLGLGPEVCLERNPRLVFGRMTGWGQDGPLAGAAGHDINYISLSGVLHSIGRPGQNPVPPLNLVGDFGGGGMLLAFGIVCALLEARRSGQGQVVDAAMTDGSAALMAAIYGIKARGMWSSEKGTNLLDSGSHFYDSYECADGKWISIGSIEPQFYALLREKAGLDDDAWNAQMEREAWPELKARLADVFRDKTREEWCELMEGSDVCFAPVLDLDEAPAHPHNRARETFVDHDGVVQPAAAPRFSRTPGAIQGPPPNAGEHSADVLAGWGFSADEIAALRDAEAI
ncbi:MAG: CaiB/BaiF CoA-transferase family protein [Thermoanaerobaculia bacterium]|nr:CaiB/BaiF CoA-transferase family protein [Thermoanaerobaculia bacterium]